MQAKAPPFFSSQKKGGGMGRGRIKIKFFVYFSFPLVKYLTPLPLSIFDGEGRFVFT